MDQLIGYMEVFGHQLEEELERMKRQRDVLHDTDLTSDDLRRLCDIYTRKVEKVTGKSFPDSPEEQFWGSIGAVFHSWNGKRAIVYRRSDGQHHMVTLWFEDRDDPWVIDPTGAMTSGMPRMSAVPEWTPLKVFTEDQDFTVLPHRMAKN